jgi:hypothetical protein
MLLDPTRFPRAALYLRSLPQELRSFPDCQVTVEAFDQVRAELAPHVPSDMLPEPLAAFIAGTQADRWIPEVAGNTLLLLLRDVVSKTDEAFLRWTYDDSRRIFHKPLYRALMAVMSPSLVALGAAKRWSAFHRGSDLMFAKITTEGGRCFARGKLVYPPRVFGGLVLARQCQAFLAGVDAAGAKESRADLAEDTPSSASFTVSWAA